MTTVNDLLRDHVTLTVECLDRVYLNGYIPTLQMPGQLVNFLLVHRGNKVPSPALLGRISDDFVARIKAFAERNEIPIVHFESGQRKDDLAAEYRQRFAQPEGVVFIGVAQEKAQAFKARKKDQQGYVGFEYSRDSVRVNHYYFYIQDADFGPLFIKVCSYAPYPIKVCLNGHEWAKQQLAKAGIAFEALDNGFLSCANPERLQASCDQLGPEQMQALFAKWIARLPMPLTATDREAGYAHRLSVWQLEVSRTQVFEDPVRGREFFEAVIRENLDLGRPDRVQLVFDRKIIKTTPGQFRTRVIEDGVQPSLHIEYKTSRIKQYFKEGRALRTETTINDPKDFGVNKDLSQMPYLAQIGRQINRRLLDVQRVSHNCHLRKRMSNGSSCLPSRKTVNAPRGYALANYGSWRSWRRSPRFSQRPRVSPIAACVRAWLICKGWPWTSTLPANSPMICAACASKASSGACPTPSGICSRPMVARWRCSSRASMRASCAQAWPPWTQPCPGPAPWPKRSTRWSTRLIA
jgi:hypothetical protein